MIATTNESTGVTVTIAPIEEWDAVVNYGQRPTLRRRDADLADLLRYWFRDARTLW